jgi:signal transduction histidine kinase
MDPIPDKVASARSVGALAVTENMSTLDLAILHQNAMVELADEFTFTTSRNGRLKQACGFFAQALVPMEKHQRETRKTNQRLQQHNEFLRLHAAELAQSNKKLAKEVVRRKAAEAAAIKGHDEHLTLFQESEVMQKKLRQLTRQIISAQENERKEISRELHDEVVQTLVGINVELAALGQGAALGMRALQAKIARTQRLVENSVNEVHRFARELRPAVLDDLGLIPALHAYCKGLAERKNVKIEITAFGGVETLADDKRTVLFRVAQEALTNAARHANATVIKVLIQQIPNAIRMEISDNGKSFQVDKVLHAPNPKRLGLIGMRERIEMIDGRLTIESLPGKGTTVRTEIPLAPAASQS